MKNDAMAEYHLKNGILQSGGSGGEAGNPMDSGISVLLLGQKSRYRHTLKWTPVAGVSWLRFDWFQLAAFVEGGRVAGDYDEDTTAWVMFSNLCDQHRSITHFIFDFPPALSKL